MARKSPRPLPSPARGAGARRCSGAAADPASPEVLDLDEDELEAVGVLYVVLDARGARVGLARAELRRRDTVGAGDGETSRRHRHDDVRVRVAVVAGGRAGSEAPLGDADRSIVELDSRNGGGNGRGSGHDQATLVAGSAGCQAAVCSGPRAGRAGPWRSGAETGGRGGGGGVRARPKGEIPRPGCRGSPS